MISVHCQETRLWELIKWSPKRKCFDLLSNSLNSFFKEICRDQFGEFVFRYWGLKVNNEDWGRGQRSVVWLMPSQPCFHHLHVLSTMCSWQPVSSFNLWIILLPPSPPPFPLINQCDRCLAPLEWGLMAEGHAFASHGSVTLSRGWLCQKWKPLDIQGTHLHEAMQLLNPVMFFLDY